MRFNYIGALILSTVASFLMCSASYATDRTVTSAADDGSPGTLRQIIAEAANGDTINFHQSLDGAIILLNTATGTIVLDKLLTITAAALSKGITVDGNSGNFPIFFASANVSLRKLSLTHAQGTGDRFPGGVLGTNRNIRLTLTECSITHNRSSQRADGIIECDGHLAISDSIITDNESEAFFNGGAIKVRGYDTSLTLINSVISNNVSRTRENNEPVSAINFVGPTITIRGCTIDENQSAMLGYTVLIASNDNAVAANISDTTFSQNVGHALTFNASQFRYLPVTISNCEFIGNRSRRGYDGSGDAISATRTNLTVQNCSFIGNRGTFSTIWAGTSNLNMSGCVMSDNMDPSASGGIYAAVLSNGHSYDNRSLSTIITDTMIVDNHWHALMLGAADQVTLRNCRILRNAGTGIDASGTQTGRNDIRIYKSSICDNVGTGDFTHSGTGGISHILGNLMLEECTIANNRGNGTGGIRVFNGNPQQNLTRLTMRYCTISGNVHSHEQYHGGGGIGCINGESVGSGVIVALDNCTISGNRTERGGGGGVFLYSGTTPCSLTMNSCTITNNSSTNFHGGGVFVQPLPTAVVNVNNTIIAGNSDLKENAPDISAGGVRSQGYNVIGKVDGSDGWIEDDQTGDTTMPLDAKLDKLADNGGPTDTHALLSDSPAIDLGDPGRKGERDQRGIIRVVPDAGAFESDGRRPGGGSLKGRVQHVETR